MKKQKGIRRITCYAVAAAMLAMLAGCTSQTSSQAAVSSDEAAPSSVTSSPASAETATKQASSESEAITSFEDINTDKVQLVAIGNSDVPVGQYSEEILTSMGFWDDIQSKISFGTNVKEVLSQVSSGSVDCGIVYATDAATEENVTVICTAPADSMQTPVVYPAAMLKQSTNKEAASAFLNFLLTDEAKAEFEKVGFKMKADVKADNTAYDGECTLTVFAAASLTESLTAIGELFNQVNPNVELVFNFDSSGTLKTQIESGAQADIFISAAQKQMTGLSDGGYIADETKTDLLENEVVLIVPKQ